MAGCRGEIEGFGGGDLFMRVGGGFDVDIGAVFGFGYGRLLSIFGLFFTYTVHMAQYLP